MKISIIVPVYNNEKYIVKCIESILNQKFSNWELILINNGSTDRSKELCEKYANDDERIILVNGENEGPSVARNKGLELATGDYCMFVDGDDYIEQDTLSILSKEIEQNDYQIVIYGNYNDIYENGVYRENGANKYREYEFNSNDEFKKIYIDLSNKYLVNQVWNKIYKKSFIEEVGTRFPQGVNYSEDLIFNIKLYKKLKKGKVIDKVLYHYVNHKGDSLCSTFNVNKYKDMKYVYMTIKEEVKGWNDELINYLGNTFVKDINIFINSMYNSDCLLPITKKRELVDEILEDETVYECIKETKIKGMRNKVTATLIRGRCKNLLLLMGKIIRLIKKS